MCHEIQASLQEFKKHFHIAKCLVDKDKIIYSFKLSHNINKACSEANMLIERLKLPLVAIHYGSNSFFTVQSNETES